MSFGFGVGDFLAVLKLANDVKDRFAQAPKAYMAIYQEVELLSTILHRIECLDENDFEEQAKDMEKVLTNCQDLLGELRIKLDNFEVLANDSTPDWNKKAQRAWKRIKWDQKEIKDFRSRIVSNISLFNLLVGCNNQSLMVERTRGIEAKQDFVIQRQDEWEREKVLSWISRSSPAARQSEVLKSRQEGTGTWAQAKTVLASTIIDHLEHSFSNQDNVGVAYYFCDYRQEQTLLGIYSAILRQLLQRQPSIPEHVSSLYKKLTQQDSRPSKDEVFEALQVTISKYNRTFIILDALDECPLSDSLEGARFSFLHKIVSLPDQANVSLLSTSRLDQEVLACFENGASMEIEAAREDIQEYINVRINDLRPFVRRRPGLVQDIKDEITDAARGMFLLARLYINLLTDQPNEKGVRTMLEHFRSGSRPNVYQDAYDQTVTRMESQGADALELSKKTIGWIMNAKEPLTVDKIEHALAIEIGSSEFDKTNITDIKQITSYCCGLVVVDTETNHVKLVHYTTQKYFEGTMGSWFPQIHQIITDSCLTFQRKNTLPMAVAGNQEATLKFLLDHGANISSCDDFGRTALHSAARGGYKAAVQLLLDNGASVDFQRNNGETPLHSAARGGHEAVIQLLLNNGASVDFQSNIGETPLHLAALWGCEAVVQLLLDNGASIDSQKKDGEAPLHSAALGGHEAVVQLLLDNGASIDSQKKDGEVPLHSAAQGGHEAVVQLLLDNGASVDSRSSHDETPLLWAALGGHEAVVQLLLDNGASIDSRSNYGGTPLNLATMCDHEAVIQLLLDNGASVDSKENFPAMHR
ncbi:ankyrin [Penicillium canariense]|uniref:Ankyrin n=1 Tax=Penicillium canariense TaxID=189055 RepID=A0A9W9LPI9_9EURO|nr:ankyrin [Penicillium canariense]KAJ5169014.1 ankyrin [Penicillium canariense]